MLYVLIFIFLNILIKISGDTYSVKIGTEYHINLIDSRFLSFTIDPKYLFSSSEKYRSKECICMASSLSPAYIRIAGPSTALLSFHNATITIDEDPDRPEDEPKPVHFQEKFADNLAKEFKGRGQMKRSKALESRFKRNHDRIEVSHKEWRKFVQWAKSTGFDLVFALNNEEKTASGIWDPNTALNILTVADKANIGDIYWQLGYECKNQSIEEYLNDLETLCVITETFAPGRAGRWKVVGGDVTNCLQADSKSDFKDYVMLSDDMMDAILLNGNSSIQELERMSERDRIKLLKLLSHSTTPLWLTEVPWSASLDQLSRAVDWLTGLGQAAKNGFSHHFRELGEEMYQPTLSFYMALLFKNLVGSKVLNVEMEASDEAIIFAHCTSLRHKPVSGAVTLYGVNLHDEMARFSVKLGKMEEGGDILQFILGNDSSGNIQVNGRSMYFEGDLKPVVKRMRPYKTLILNLPPKSFGFWVLANTKVNACYSDEDISQTKESGETLSTESLETERPKIRRSVLKNDFEDYTPFSDMSVDFFEKEENVQPLIDKTIIGKMSDLKKDLNKVQKLFKYEPKGDKRTKRQTLEERINERKSKLRRYGISLRNSMSKKSDSEQKPRRIIGNLIQLTRRNLTRNYKNGKRRQTRFSKNKVSKRNPKSKAQQFKPRVKHIERPIDKPSEISDTELKVRTRRNVDERDILLYNSPEPSLENLPEGIDPADKRKFWIIVERVISKKLKEYFERNKEPTEENDINIISSSEDEQDEEEDIAEEDKTGFIKRSVNNVKKVLSDLNTNLHKAWDLIHYLY